jgi:hypothetical protein
MVRLPFIWCKIVRERSKNLLKRRKKELKNDSITAYLSGY